MSRMVMVTSDSEIDQRIIQQALNLQAIGHHVIIIASAHPAKPQFSIENELRIERHLTEPSTLFEKIVNRVFNKTTGETKVLQYIYPIMFRGPILSFKERSLHSRINSYRPDMIQAHDFPVLLACLTSARELSISIGFGSKELSGEIESLSTLRRLRYRHLENQLPRTRLQ